MICPQCKTPNRDSAKFCDECGWRLGGVEESTLPSIAVEPSEDEVSSIGEGEVVHPDAFGGEEPSVDIWRAASSLEVSVDEPVGHDGPVVREGDDQVDKDAAKRSADLSGFVFVDGGSDVPDSGLVDPTSFNAFDTAAIPVGRMWNPTTTEAIPRVELDAASEPQTVSAPANKKDERARRRAMKQQEREARKQLKDAQNSNGGSKRKMILLGVLGIVIALGLTAGFTYYFGAWGGHAVPDVQGMTEADAKYTLEREGFSVRVTHVKSDDTDGQVILTDPGAGSRVSQGSEVVIHVTECRVVPSVVGASAEKAKSSFDEEGFASVDYKAVKTNDAAEGTVLSVSPAAGTKAKASTKITVEVAKPYRVPDVVGMTSDNATYTLREAGYYVYVNEVVSTEVPEGTVYATSPAKDELLDRDGYVTIYVAVSRSTYLNSLAYNYLASAGQISINGTTFVVDSVLATSYVGNGMVSFSIMGSPTTTFFGQTITVYSREVTGMITFDDNNQIVGIG